MKQVEYLMARYEADDLEGALSPHNKEAYS